MREKLGLILLVSVFFLSSAFGAKTVKTIQGSIGYVSQTEADYIYYTDVTIDPPDGIVSVQDLRIKVRGDYQADTKIYSAVNDTFCIPEYYQPVEGVLDYNTVFDCTPLAKAVDFTGGTVEFGFMTDKIAQNVYGEYELTYYNKPSISADVKGTEYHPDCQGRTFLQLLDGKRHAIEDATCYASIYRPDTTLLKNQSLMAHAGDGLYYVDFPVPDELGVYMVSAYCVIGDVINVSAKDGFESGSLSGGSGGWTSDWHTSGTINVDASIDTANSGDYSMRLEGGGYSWTGERGWSNRTINTSALDKVKLSFYGNFQGVESGEYAELWVTDASGSSQRLLRLDDGEDDGQWHYYSYALNGTFDLDGEVELGYFLSGSSRNDEWYIDDVSVGGEENYSTKEYQSVRGSGEVHVCERKPNETAEYVWNYPNRTLTDYNQSGVFDELDDISSLISNINSTIMDEVESTNQTLYWKVDSTNNSVMYELYETQDEIASVNDTVKAESGDIQNLINDVENTVLNELGDVNETLYWEVNRTGDEIALKLSAVRGDISSVNDTVKSANQTIMDRLFDVQGELKGVNLTIKREHNLTRVLVSNKSKIIYNVTGNLTRGQEGLKRFILAVNDMGEGAGGITGMAVLPSLDLGWGGLFWIVPLVALLLGWVVGKYIRW